MSENQVLEARVLLAENAKELMNAAIDHALEGDKKLLHLLLGHILPKKLPIVAIPLADEETPEELSKRWVNQLCSAGATADDIKPTLDLLEAQQELELLPDIARQLQELTGNKGQKKL